MTIDDQPGKFAGWFVWFDSNNGRPNPREDFANTDLESRFKGQYGWGKTEGKTSNFLRLYPPQGLGEPDAVVYQRDEVVDQQPGQGVDHTVGGLIYGTSGVGLRYPTDQEGTGYQPG